MPSACRKRTQVQCGLVRLCVDVRLPGLAAAFDEMTTLSQLLFVSAYAIEICICLTATWPQAFFSPVSQCTG
jgi:hypothetical protein